MIAHMENRPRNVSSWLLAVACAAIACLVTALQPMWAYPVPPGTENPASPLLTFALQQESAPTLPTPYGHWAGDLDGMLKRRQVRALVVYSKSAFFCDRGRPEGTSYEALREFQRTPNRKFETGNLPFPPGWL
jgi:hypothetical protein